MVCTAQRVLGRPRSPESELLTGYTFNGNALGAPGEEALCVGLAEALNFFQGLVEAALGFGGENFAEIELHGRDGEAPSFWGVAEDVAGEGEHGARGWRREP